MANTPTRLSIAIVGAGLGGLSAALTLCRFGFDVQVYEQATGFARIGAGIQMMPNSMKVLRRIGIEERVRATSFEPYSHLNRQWDTADVMRELPMPESLFGAPYLCNSPNPRSIRPLSGMCQLMSYDLRQLCDRDSAGRDNGAPSCNLRETYQ